jgi:hypothetical protein
LDQVHDRLLLDLANLYQLHAAHSRRSRNVNHPPMVAVLLQPLYYSLQLLPGPAGHGC